MLHVPHLRLPENTHCKGQWMWWLAKNSTDICWVLVFFWVKLFHCRPLNFTGIQSGCVAVPSAIVCSHAFYSSIFWEHFCYYHFYLTKSTFLQLHLTLCPHTTLQTKVSLLCPWYRWIRRGTNHSGIIPTLIQYIFLHSRVCCPGLGTQDRLLRYPNTKQAFWKLLSGLKLAFKRLHPSI